MSDRKKRRKTPQAAKKPALGVQPIGGRRPREAPDGRSLEDGCPTWRFGLCDRGGDWAWDDEAFYGHLATIRAIEAKTWAASSGSGTVGCLKRIPVENVCSEAQARLRRIKLDDFDAVWEIRLGGAPRFWGVRIDQCFHFVWWDPHHTVCPSKKRNT